MQWHNTACSQNLTARSASRTRVVITTTRTAKFGINDSVRFIGTDSPLCITELRCCNETDEYRLHRCCDEASMEWVQEIYLELVAPA